MNSIETALKQLNKDSIRNINIINFIKDYSITECHIAGASVLIKGISDVNWVYISSESKDEFNELMNYVYNHDKYFALVEDWMLPYITNSQMVDWTLSCIKFFLPEEVTLPYSRIQLSSINIEEAEYIYSNYEYKQYTSLEYVRDRIIKQGGYGVHEDNKLVGWILTQDDGALGLLNVLAPYRRKGYGNELTIALSKKVRQQGRHPVVHIEESNYKSVNNALKIGFKKYKTVNWVKLK